MTEYDTDERIFDTIHSMLINIQVGAFLFFNQLRDNAMNDNKKFQSISFDFQRKNIIRTIIP